MFSILANKVKRSFLRYTGLHMLIDFNRYFESPQPPKEKKLAELSGVLLHLGERRIPKASRLFTGGFRNQNYLITFVSQYSTPVVLRISADILEAKKEATLLKTYAGRFPLPQLLGERETFIHHLSLLSYCPGILPAQLDADLKPESLEALGQAIGSTLASIHQQPFDKSGFLGPDLSLAIPFEHQGKFWLKHMQQLLGVKAFKDKLGEALQVKLHQLLETKGQALLDLPETPCLVHSDFNLKNMLVSQIDGFWRVEAVLDWEFAHAGSPLTDIGNFIRFQNQLPTALISGFLAGYQALKGPLPTNWEVWTRLLDMTALMTFIERAHQGSKTLETAKTLLEATLSFFNDD